MKQTYIVLVVIIAVLALGVGAIAAFHYSQEPTLVVEPNPETPAPSVEVPMGVLPYGSVTLALGQEAVFADVRIRPLAVVEDSRCPMNARCIQAGTVRVRTEIVSGMGTSTDAIELGKSITTEAEEVFLTAVAPDTMAGEAIAPGDYRFTYNVLKRTAVQAPLPCYVGGCSSQLCSDRPDMVSTCEYREAYACYKTARCERQASGQCGWTQTEALRMCLQGTS